MEHKRHRIACLLISSLLLTALFFHSLSKKKIQLKDVYGGRQTIEEKDEKLASPAAQADQRAKGVLQKRERVLPPPLLPPEDLPPGPLNPARPHRPNLTHLADTPVETALRALVREYLSPWLSPSSPSSLQQNTPPFRLTQRALAVMEYSYKGGAFRVRISQGRLYYRKLVYWRQTYRSQRMLWFLRLLYDIVRERHPTAAAAAMSDTDFVVYVGDGPKVAADTYTTDAGFPLFSLRSSLAHVDIPVPDPVSFGSNGQYLWSEDGKRVKWSGRADRMVFRGRGSCLKMQADNWHVCNRVRAQKLASQHPQLLDIGIIEWNQLYQSRLCDRLTEAEIEAATGLSKVAPMDFTAQSAYKYILDLDGGLGSSRKPGILSSGSVLFAQDSPWYTWYEPLMAAYRHYIPVDRWLRSLVEQVQWGRRNDLVMHAIQQQGAAFEKKFLTLSAAKLYMGILLEEYSMLLEGAAAGGSGNEAVLVDYCEKMKGSHGAAEISAGPMGCSTGWFEYTGEGSVPEHVLNDRAAFKNAKDNDNPW